MRQILAFILSAVVAFPVQAETLTLQPDATAGVDNTLVGSAPTSNQGTNVSLASRATSNLRSIIKFDLSEIPAGSTCISATITLTTRSTGNGGEHNISALKAANGAWTEGGSNWNTIDGSNAWAGSAGASTSGTDFNATPMGTATASTSDGVANVFTLDCAQVEPWYGNAANYGAVVWNTSGAGDQFYSSDEAGASSRPKFETEYTPADVPPVAGGDDQEWGEHWTNGRWMGRFQ